MTSLFKLKNQKISSSIVAPIIPLRNVVIYPLVTIGPIFIGRSKSLEAVRIAQEHNGGQAIFVAQKNQKKKDPGEHDLYSVGTLCFIKNVFQKPDGSFEIHLEGLSRVKIKSHIQNEPILAAQAEEIIETREQNIEYDALIKTVINLYQKFLAAGKNLTPDSLFLLLETTDPHRLCEMIMLTVNAKLEDRQELLEIEEIGKRLRQTIKVLSREIEVLQVGKKIQDQTAKELNQHSREVYLREQLRSIKKELGMDKEESAYKELEQKVKKMAMPEEVKKRALKELERLEEMPSYSPEVSYIRTYLDWLTDLPWGKKDESRTDLKLAAKILDEDHYGLQKVKERILEYLAVQKLTGQMRGPILCFVGPPGTGKTSIGKSIARALERKFVRVSLGGIRDEAEIRGHRRTYVGALPGRIIQGIKTAGSSNPVFMLDEIDKIGNDFRGDPSAALLEALDPEQNREFSDHYLEVPYNLSDVIFIATANLLDTIPPALRDRLEIIPFPGYTEEEKLNISKKYLLPKQIKNHGLDKFAIEFTPTSQKKIISEYTHEAGVRNLERELAAICRKLAKKIAGNGKSKTGKIKITSNNLARYLGSAKFHLTEAEKKGEIGLVNGLAVTEAGGDVLTVEVNKMPGKGSLILTGQLGKVMQESATAALSFVRGSAEKWGIKENQFGKFDWHIHAPAGAIPKDGPSAGISMGAAIASVLLKKKIRPEVGMTGEITLRGRVLEIGGVKEKVLAAHRAGLKKIILPKLNRHDLEEIPAKIRKDLKFVFVEEMERVLKEALIDIR